MRSFVLALATLAIAAPAGAQTKIDDGECWAAFQMLSRSAAKAPALKALMDKGSSAAQAAILKQDPKASTADMGRVLQVYGGELAAALQNKTTTPDQVMQKTNACEAQYGLPATDFAKFRG